MGLLDKAEQTSTGQEETPSARPLPSLIETDIDAIYHEVMSTGRMSIKTIASTHTVSEAKAEEWAGALDKQGLLEIFYPTIGEPELRVKITGQTKKPVNTKKNLFIFSLAMLLMAVLAIFFLKRQGVI
ncbi:hypothetical protein J4460_06705 [Candidatus Woesearchaeota archaeon]|nr:MAG: hypothetical protein QS99_C0017G0013 [archaeon GW2011_AR4]MBS3130330.1 hypothetical protein [Candidatus Woesearchaeota archaeon]HIH38949.1 hypothetical protein [Candidatus Woesearchaeota archaeon]HIJ03410.1 hypothetical protein [Candidatus Woesearchaeota archaeon]